MESVRWVSDSGVGGLCIVYFCLRILLVVFPFPLSTAQ
jgi:hypothetical protein